MMSHTTQCDKEFDDLEDDDSVIIHFTNENEADVDSCQFYTCSDKENELQFNNHETHHHATTKTNHKIAEREDIFVIRMKFVVTLTLIASATVLAVTVYYVSLGSLYHQAMRDFQIASTEILTVTENVGSFIHESMDLLSTVTTIEALHDAKLKNLSGTSWPYFTVRNFQRRVGAVRSSTRSRLIVFSPLIRTNEIDSWNTYSQAKSDWIQESLSFQNQKVDPEFRLESNGSALHFPVVHSKSSQLVALQNDESYISPLWQISPCPTNLSILNYDLLQNSIYKAMINFTDKGVRPDGTIALSSVIDVSNLIHISSTTNVDSKSDSFNASKPVAKGAIGLLPETFTTHPVFSNFSNITTEDSIYFGGEVVGHYVMVLRWDEYFENILPPGTNGIICVLWNSCGQAFTYDISGPNVSYLGVGDLHDKTLDYLKLKRTAPFSESFLRDTYTGFIPFPETRQSNDANCQYYVSLYASSKFFDQYPIKRKPFQYLAVVIAIFVSTSLVFVLFDYFVTRRQNKILGSAMRTHQIVGSLFPQAICDKLMQEQKEDSAKERQQQKMKERYGHEKEFPPIVENSSKAGLKHFFTDTAYNTTTVLDKSKPIAELFPNTTVMFADISGFSAWSSVREPYQVFTLLETVYHGFDTIARIRRVFKVETVGDCYVAVAGLPDPRHDHAVVMARFARDCLVHMKQLVAKLTLVLGPGTEDLTIRIGLHSGPVTAGVLRGDRARFQLFGDTMNTTARIETTGIGGKIHISKETANLLQDAHKSIWIEERGDVVVAKGKGALQTFWLKNTIQPSSSSGRQERSTGGNFLSELVIDLHEDGEQVERSCTNASTKPTTNLDTKKQQLIEWNCELLLQLLKKIVAHRYATSSSIRNQNISSLDSSVRHKVELEILSKKSCLQDIVEIINMPMYKSSIKNIKVDANVINIGEEVTKELHDYVAMLESMYHNNPFHNFEHASHVTMSISKLLGRIVAPDIVKTSNCDSSSTYSSSSSSDGRVSCENVAVALHDHTYGITSDPLTQFGVILSGLIHDVDHRGVPNFVLVNEDPSLAHVYNGKSVAEQNSVAIAWQLLMEPRYERLRSCIYQNETELLRFRQLLVNSVMATDIFDKDLSALRKCRWDKAFKEHEEFESQKQIVDRKATIVIEHLIQASDVAHTMQHWQVYQKWNSRLFNEMYKAYTDGRTTTNPAASWYDGELAFFDNYVIPLSKKLKECGVFGVSSDECLNYALENRRTWERKGKNIVEELVEAQKKCN